MVTNGSIARHNGSMDLRRVHYFLILCNTFNFSDAAKSLGISQPALTKAILRLEEELGGKLLRREGRHTHLTPFGDAMKVHFDELELVANKARTRASQLLRGQLAKIQVAVLNSLGPIRIAHALSVYRTQYPGVDLFLYDADPAELTEMLLSGSVDCAMVAPPIENHDRLRHISLYEEEIVVVHRNDHRFAESNSVTLDELADEVILHATSGLVSNFVVQSRKSLDTDAGCVVQTDRIAWVQSLVLAGFGLAIVPEDALIQAELRTTPIRIAPQKRIVSLAVPRGRSDNPIVCGFVDCVKAQLQ